MCKKANKESKVLEDRTKGLDSRGNRALNTQAETNWATGALKSLNTDTEAQALITDELKRVYDDCKKLRGPINWSRTHSFENGFEDYFGEYKEDSKTKQLRRVKPPKASPQPQDLVNLMLEGKYQFKEAVSWVADLEAKTDVGRPLYKRGRGDVPEFQNRGRKEGRKRRNSFIGPHAGIADHVFRPEGAENFFTRDVEHAKGMLEGDPTSATYNKFLAQGAPFIGGASGTIQGIALCWEAKQKLDDIQDGDQREEEIARREKTMGIYMATLVAGGHHSMSEMLFAAQQYGLFQNITNPLDNYALAMKQFGEHLQDLGLPGDLTPKPGDTWQNALTKVQGEIAKIRKEINAYLGGKDEADDDDADDDDPTNKGKAPDVKSSATKKKRTKILIDSDDDDSHQGSTDSDDDASQQNQQDPVAAKRTAVLKAFQNKIEGGFSRLFPDDLDTTLDRVVDALRNQPRDDQQVADAKQAAGDLIAQARDALDDDLIKGLDENPFVPVSVRKTLSDALNEVSSVAS